MVAMYLIVVAFFVALVAIGYFAVVEGEERRGAPLDALGAAPAGAPGAACTACDDVARPARAATSDQVVFEIEHRIDAELRDISHALHAHPKSLTRLFHS
jgi:hypothetical protein